MRKILYDSPAGDLLRLAEIETALYHEFTDFMISLPAWRIIMRRHCARIADVHRMRSINLVLLSEGKDYPDSL